MVRQAVTRQLIDRAWLRTLRGQLWHAKMQMVVNSSIGLASRSWQKEHSHQAFTLRYWCKQGSFGPDMSVTYQSYMLVNINADVIAAFFMHLRYR